MERVVDYEPARRPDRQPSDSESSDDGGDSRRVRLRLLPPRSELYDPRLLGSSFNEYVYDASTPSGRSPPGWSGNHRYVEFVGYGRWGRIPQQQPWQFSGQHTSETRFPEDKRRQIVFESGTPHKQTTNEQRMELGPNDFYRNVARRADDSNNEDGGLIEFEEENLTDAEEAAPC